MNCLPNVKSKICKGGYLTAESLCWNFAPDTDKRVISAAERISVSSAKGTSVNICHGNSSDEGYELLIGEKDISIRSGGAAGAFYALQTLKMMLSVGEGRLEVCEISDFPDMKQRGFYQDTTRGRIPTLDTLKKLADRMAEYKLNMLQLYVEHSFDFCEYGFCKEKLGYLTAEEIKELDEYCRERFIDLVPSLSCFGHLYHLLQSEKYKHLCELKDYEPREHHFAERMAHHTINPLLDESFELIKSLIDQHMEAFTSEYFNICCDETFDLGRDVNRDRNKAELYVGFVEKLIRYVEGKGKKVMMWGDIVLKYSGSAEKLPDSITYLNWDYSGQPCEANVERLSGRTQLVCPGTWSWIGFSERICRGRINIQRMAELGNKYRADGLLNTNWGDMGNLASIEMAMYGMILGAAVSWNKDTKVGGEYDSFVCAYHYGNADAVRILEFFDDIEPISNWTHIMKDRVPNDIGEGYYKEKIKTCTEIIKRIEGSNFKTENLKKIFLIAAEGYCLLMQWCGATRGIKTASGVDFEKWLDAYECSFLAESKPSELTELKKLFREFNYRVLN